MWKYKEFFTFSELGNTPNSGELNFVYAIIEKNSKIKTARDLNYFIQKINNRFDSENNFCIVLKIFSQISKYHSIPYVK